MKYRVWNPNDEGEEDGQLIEDVSPDEAAIRYVTASWDNTSDSIDVMVKDEEGNQYDVTVDADFEPNFSAYSTKVKK